MRAKTTSNNRPPLPKSVIASVAPTECPAVEAPHGQIILAPVRPQRSDAVRAKLAELDLGEADITAAVSLARRRR